MNNSYSNSSKTLTNMNNISFEIEDESDYKKNSYSLNLDLNEDSTENKTNLTNNLEIDDTSCYIPIYVEKDSKSILIDFIKEEKEILMKTLSGFILCHSVERNKIDLEYLCKKVSPVIGKLINYNGIKYKVIKFLIYL